MTQLTNNSNYDFNNDLYQQIDINYQLKRKALRRKKRQVQPNNSGRLLIGIELEDAVDEMLLLWGI